jgi:NADH-quinone oxidoreductase subunit G
VLGDDPSPVRGAHRAGAAVLQPDGHHGDAGASRADVILPGAAYTEKNGLYVNMEGRVQMARKAVEPPGEAREDWKILRALSSYIGRQLPYDDLFQLRERIAREWPHLAQIDEIVPASWGDFGRAGKTAATPFVSAVPNFYMTNVITRASVTMAECTKVFLHGDVADNMAGAAE